VSDRKDQAGFVISLIHIKMLFRSHRFTKEARKDPVLESLLGQGILYTAALIPLKLRS